MRSVWLLFLMGALSGQACLAMWLMQLCLYMEHGRLIALWVTCPCRTTLRSEAIYLSILWMARMKWVTGNCLVSILVHRRRDAYELTLSDGA